MAIICKFSDGTYDMRELAELLCDAFESGIMTKKDREIYTQIVYYTNQCLQKNKGNIFALSSEMQLICNYLRKIAFAYAKTPFTNWDRTEEIYQAMVTAIKFTHRLEPRDYEIMAQIGGAARSPKPP